MWYHVRAGMEGLDVCTRSVAKEHAADAQVADIALARVVVPKGHRNPEVARLPPPLRPRVLHEPVRARRGPLPAYLRNSSWWRSYIFFPVPSMVPRALLTKSPERLSMGLSLPRCAIKYREPKGHPNQACRLIVFVLSK